MRLRLAAASPPASSSRVRAHRARPRSGRGDELDRARAAPRCGPRVLDVVRDAGVEIRGLTAEEGRLDALYRELVAEAPGSSTR